MVPAGGILNDCNRNGSRRLKVLFFQPDLPIFQALWDQNFWGKKKHLLWIRITRSFSGRPHNSANIFWDVKYHYDCDFCVNRGHKSTRKMEGDDVSREHLIPILVLLIKARSLLGPHIYKDRQVGDVKVKGILSCSDLEMVKLKILRGRSRAERRITTLDFKRADWPLQRSHGTRPCKEEGSEMLGCFKNHLVQAKMPGGFHGWTRSS